MRTRPEVSYSTVRPRLQLSMAGSCSDKQAYGPVYDLDRYVAIPAARSCQKIYRFR